MGKVVSFVSGQVTTGASGAVLTSPALAAEQYIRIRQLSSITSTQSGMTLSLDGVDIFTNRNLNNGASPSTTTASSTGFMVSEAYGSTDTTLSARILTDVYCSSFTLTKVSGTTNRVIDYAYEILEPL